LTPLGGARYELRRFGAGDPPDVRDISTLHAALLPDSPVTRLGAGFRETFYYKNLPELSHVFGVVAYVEGRAAGFVAATHDSDGFMSSALRQRGLRVAWVIARALLGDLRRIQAVWEASRIHSDRNQFAGRGAGAKHEPPGEILSLGVLPQFRDAAFQSLSGLHIGRDLAACAMETFRTHGAAKVRVIVDTDNLPAQRFYEKLGWRQSRRGLPGWRRPSDEFIWEPAQERSA
jgi:ribosomal protein S18 acetylase RimI-like enzyme